MKLVKLTNPGKDAIRECYPLMGEYEPAYDLDEVFGVFRENRTSAWLVQGKEELIIPKIVTVDGHARLTYHKDFKWMRDPELFRRKLMQASEGLSPEEWKEKLKRAGIGKT